jgi:hypothetical protein
MKLNNKNLSKLENRTAKQDVVFRKENKPIIGITFLDKNNYGLIDLYKVYRGDKSCLRQFNDFLEKARSYDTITELIDNHKPHDKFKNEDEKSIQKLSQIQKEYNIEATDMCHLHCCRDGKGIFVLHGFILGNCFEIVWLDAKHDLH